MVLQFSIAKARQRLRSGLFTSDWGKNVLMRDIDKGITTIEIYQRDKLIKRNDEFVSALRDYHLGDKTKLDVMKEIVHLI